MGRMLVSVASLYSTYYVPSTPTYSSASQLAATQAEASTEPTTVEAKSAAHVLHAPQSSGHAAAPAGSSASVHGVEGTWFATHVVSHVRVADVTKMSSPSAASLFAIVTEPESSKAVAPPAIYRAPPFASACGWRERMGGW